MRDLGRGPGFPRETEVRTPCPGPFQTVDGEVIKELGRGSVEACQCSSLES